MTKVLDWQKHWNGNTKVQTIAEWMWLQNSNNIVAILRQLEQSILSIAAKILETLALSILLSFTPNHELEHWEVGGSEILNIFDEAGKIFFSQNFASTLLPMAVTMRKIFCPLSYISTNPHITTVSFGRCNYLDFHTLVYSSTILMFLNIQKKSDFLRPNVESEIVS